METNPADFSDHEYRRFCCCGCGHSFDAPVYCGNRFCAICNSGRRRRIRSKLQYIVQYAAVPKGYRWRFVTLTIPRQPDLYVGAKTLISAFRKLRSRKFWQSKVAGGAYVLEVIGTPGNWFAHLHVLVLSSYIPQKQLASNWAKCSPGRIVHIKFIPPSAIINYVVKYVTKTDLDPAHQLAASHALKGFRLFQPFGCLHVIAQACPKVLYTCKSCGYDHFIPQSLQKIPYLAKRLIDIQGFPDPWKNQPWGISGP